MLIAIAILSLVAALILLGFLAYIDMKIYLLPNELVLGLAAAGLVFHLCTIFHFVSLQDMALGAFIGGGILYVIRGAANFYYKDDTLGLGDVKLLAAGGLWLGSEHILIAMTIGALSGFLHGLAAAFYTTRKTGTPMDLNRLSVPAGPGFAAGLITTAVLFLHELPALIISGVLS